MRMASSKTSAEQPPSHKATLSCPTCNHANLINGDWLIHIHSDSLVYECPDCETTIDSCHDEAALITQSDGSLQFGSGN